MSAEVWTLGGSALVMLGGIVTALLVRRSSREGVSVESRKVDLEEFRTVTSELRTDLNETRTRLDHVERERGIDALWIDMLRLHIMNGNPPPPPARPVRA